MIVTTNTMAKYFMFFMSILSIACYSINTISPFLDEEQQILVIEDLDDSQGEEEKQESEDSYQFENDIITHITSNRVFAITECTTIAYPEFEFLPRKVFLEYITPPPELGYI